jgi:hypothetical protein
MESANNEQVKMSIISEPTSEPTSEPSSKPTSEPTSEPTSDGFTKVTRGKSNYKNVSPNITLEQFKSLLSKDKIVFFDSRGKSTEFYNEGIVGRHYDTIKDKDKMKYKYTVSMKTYLHLSGDVVIMEWLDGEVKYTTKLNHSDLKNWSSKMYWKEA